MTTEPGIEQAVAVKALKPCPFERGTCDHDALLIITAKDPSGRKGVKLGYVSCEDCGARGPVCFSSAEEIRGLAAYSWNDRASPLPVAAQGGVTEDLRSLIDEFRAGLEGVTPGPWRNMPKSDLELCKKEYAPGEHPSSPNIIAESVVSVDLVDDEPVLCVSEPTRAHIARCFPENIAKLLDALEASITKTATPLGVETKFSTPVSEEMRERVAARAESLERIGATEDAADLRALLSALSLAPAEAKEAALADAMHTGLGVMRMKSDGSLEHIPEAEFRPSLASPQADDTASGERDVECGRVVDVLNSAKFAIEATDACLRSWNGGRGSPSDNEGIVDRINDLLATLNREVPPHE